MLEQNTYRGSFQQLADARRALKVVACLDRSPVMAIEDREELKRIRSLAIRCVGAAVSELVETLDVLEGDADLEDDDPAESCGDEDDGSNAEDEQLSLRALSKVNGPGCVISDPGRGIDDDPHDWDELELDEGACGHTRRYGIDQSLALPIGPDDPEAA